MLIEVVINYTNSRITTENDAKNFVQNLVIILFCIQEVFNTCIKMILASNANCVP